MRTERDECRLDVRSRGRSPLVGSCLASLGSGPFKEEALPLRNACGVGLAVHKFAVHFGTKRVEFGGVAQRLSLKVTACPLERPLLLGKEFVKGP